MEVRDFRPDEAPFLHVLLYAALAWRPGVELPPLDRVLAHHQVEPFHRDWGRAGDVALVTEEDGRPVGLVWYRRFTEGDHGEGFVDEETPELAIAGVDGFRERGIGRTLMAAAREPARADGIHRVSISVDDDSPARRLYEALGYVEYAAGDDDRRTTLELA